MSEASYFSVLTRLSYNYHECIHICATGVSEGLSTHCFPLGCYVDLRNVLTISHVKVIGKGQVHFSEGSRGIRLFKISY